MALRGTSPGAWRSALLVLVPLIVLVPAPATAPQAADYDGDGLDDGFDYSRPKYPKHEEPEDTGETGRKSTWELSTSLTFHRYLEPFPRVDSARACRNRCAANRRCTGWTYYDSTFSEAGRFSYKLQRLCVLGAGGVKSKQVGNRPGRTSGVLAKAHQDGGGGAGE